PSCSSTPSLLLSTIRPPPSSTLFPYTTLFRSVHKETVVRTGNGSRAELSFSDETVVRLAAHTAFDFNRGTRGLNLKDGAALVQRSEEHTSELQSRSDLVCRLLLEKKKKKCVRM